MKNEKVEMTLVLAIIEIRNARKESDVNFFSIVSYHGRDYFWHLDNDLEET